MGQKGKPASLEERIEVGERWKEALRDLTQSMFFTKKIVFEMEKPSICV